MSTYICSLDNFSKSVNGKVIIKPTWLSFIYGAKIGIIGPNGAGKTTLLRVLAGVDNEYDGTIVRAPNYKIGYLAQEPKLDEEKSVYENIKIGLKEKTKALDEYYEVTRSLELSEVSDEEMDRLISRMAELQEEIDSTNGWNINTEIDLALEALKCPAKDSIVKFLSGGEKRRVALCKLLLEKPDMLLLDEPTNHLDADSVFWLEKFLQDYKGTAIVVTHDRYFLDNVAEWILEIDRGECVPWQSNYSSWLDKKQKKLEQEEKEESDRQKQLKSEREWIAQNPKGRQAKSKSRINAYNEMLNRSINKMVTSPQIIIPKGPRLGDKVVEAIHISKKFGDKTLLSDFSFNVLPGSIVGIIGPNGAGKSTLFNMIIGKDKPDSGEIKLGSTVSLGYVDQTRDNLDDNKTVWEEISGGAEDIDCGEYVIKSRAYCAAFNFRGQDQQKLVGKLSGGERNRVHMAKLLKNPANVILLDEPSNDLDLDTLRALEDAIMNFPGCVFVISHDRWFLDRIATHIIAFDQVGNATWFEGNYTDYHEYMIKHFGSDYAAKNTKRMRSI